MTDAEVQLLRAARPPSPQLVEVVVTGCAFSCCGKGWQRRDGYEQTYRGWIDNFTEPDGEAHGTFMLYSGGIGGGLSYVIACRFFEVAAVQAA